jgi:uncharacterized delta-60 repeat protein
VQPDRKVVVVGTSKGDFVAARYNDDGAIDEDFGINGKVSIDLGGDDTARSVVMDGDKIVIAGTTDKGWAVAIVNASGSLNTATFRRGFMGFAITSASADAWNLSRNTQTGDFYIAGIVHPDDEHDSPFASVQRFGPNLQLLWDQGKGVIPNVIGEQTAMVVQPNGMALLACKVKEGIAVARFQRNGKPDGAFGTDGIQIVRFGSASQDVFGITLDADAKIVLCGSKGSGANSQFAFARLTPAGELDSSFNHSGVVSATPRAGSKAVARDVAVLPDGSIVAAGSALGNFAAVRFSPEGELDSTFDLDGIVTSDFGSPTDAAVCIALNDDYSFYLAGNSSSDFAVGRYKVDTMFVDEA